MGKEIMTDEGLFSCFFDITKKREKRKRNTEITKLQYVNANDTKNKKNQSSCLDDYNMINDDDTYYVGIHTHILMPPYIL